MEYSKQNLNIQEYAVTKLKIVFTLIRSDTIHAIEDI